MTIKHKWNACSDYNGPFSRVVVGFMFMTVCGRLWPNKQIGY